LGILLHPRQTFTAFVRGRHSKNLYRSRWQQEDLLGKPTEVLAAELGVNNHRRATPGDWIAFIGWAIVALVTLLVIPALLFILIALLVGILS
jgi:hypothetical protein